MVKVRTAKSKGNNLEYDTQASLLSEFHDLYRTCERGYQRQFDLCSDRHKITIECKRHKSFSWNELRKIFAALCAYSPEGYTPYLVFQGNRQPVLVMYKLLECVTVQDFEDVFGIPFIRHESTRVKKDDN